MIRKLLGFLAVLMIAVVAMWNMSFGSKTNSRSDVMLANVEALAENENCPDPVYIRTDADCVYSFTGKAGATFTVFGVTLTFNAQGEATYTYKDGKTHCKSGGDEQCEARYCPPITG